MYITNVEDIRTVSEKEWKNAIASYFKQWKKLERSYGKLICRHVYGDPSPSIEFPPAQVKGKIELPYGLEEVSYVFWKNDRAGGITVEMCKKCGGFKVEFIKETTTEKILRGI